MDAEKRKPGETQVRHGSPATSDFRTNQEVVARM